MGNNETSGMVVAVALAQWIQSWSRMPQRYSYRFVFVPETIGSIVYLSKHHKAMKAKTKAGFVVACMGDDRAYSYVESREANTISDRIVRHVSKHLTPDPKIYKYISRGSDERQYGHPLIDLPVVTLTRSKFGEYPEYHTSLDDLSLISQKGLAGGFEYARRCIAAMELNRVYAPVVPCEPQLGHRGLYPTLSSGRDIGEYQLIPDLIAFVDGKKDLLELSEVLGKSIFDVAPAAALLLKSGLLRMVR
jgi:aminopeptidase-like protein